MNCFFNIFIIIFSISTIFSCSEKNSQKDDNDTGIDTDNTELSDDHTDDLTEVNDETNDEQNENDFEEGPYGISFGDTAGNFVLPLETGEWEFSGQRSSLENYIFIFYRPLNSQSKSIWETDMIVMFDSSPENTHYFFLIDGSEEIFAEKIEELKTNIKNSIEISGNSKITEKIHIVSKPVRQIDSWLIDWLEKYSDFFLGIDRFQKIRKGGLFHSWKSSSLSPEFQFLYKEAELYNYEYELDSFLEEHNHKSTSITGIDGTPFDDEGWVKELFFTADFPQLSKPGKLFIFLEQICESEEVCEWDRLQQLFLCEDENSDSCTIEIGRWITTYGRSGKWLTDISPLLSFFKDPGKYKFKFTVNGDNYTNYLKFIFVEDDEFPIPSGVIPLYSGTVPFDENYNDHFEELSIDIPDNIKKAFISAYITGHGNGSEEANCAEFCSFESVFYVNGNPFSTKFKNAGSSLGCYDLVSEGVVPNQYGSWPFGRAGWCPGQDVKLINIDITDHIKPGENNTFHFESLLNGEKYVPVVTDPSGYRAEIPMSSQIVLW